MPSLADVAEFLDTTLNISAIPDYPAAVNGVQLANTGAIDCVAAAVDFSSETVSGAIAAGAQLLLVHHGMFWGGVQALTGHRHRRLHALITHDVAVYAAHLPLDVHPSLGNNALLARLLELEPRGGFAKYQSIDVGLSGTSNIPTRMLAEKARALAEQYGGQLVATPFAADRMTRAWGICSGAGAAARLDVFSRECATRFLQSSRADGENPDVDVNAYLERIGARRPTAPTLDALAALDRARLGWSTSSVGLPARSKASTTRQVWLGPISPGTRASSMRGWQIRKLSFPALS
jgi:putative NIF3 family GTP cyclohydrolase 1 type 2